MIITIAHQKGGVGKSTIAFNLAYFLQKENIDVTLIDLDLQKSLTLINEMRKEPLKIIQISYHNLEKIIQENNKNTLCIIDVGGFDSDINRIAILGADILLTPVSSQGLDLLGLQTFEEILTEISKASKKEIIAHIFLNKINPSTRKFEELKNYIASSQYYYILNSIIRNRIDIADAIAQGLSIEEYNPKSKSIEEIKNLISEIKLL